MNPTRELMMVARELSAASDLGDIRRMIPEMQAKYEEYARIREEALRKQNEAYNMLTEGVARAVADLSAEIGDNLIFYFRNSGMGIRRTDVGKSLVEVFIGSDDGVRREQSKVSTHISFLPGVTPRFSFMLRNENLSETIEGELKDRDTIRQLLRVIQKVEKRGFWQEGV